MQRDEINWSKTNIPSLFSKMFVPTLLGMLMIASINLFDGAFVGHGVGSDALAAINIVAPFFLLSTGFGLMFGAGASIVASIHLAKGKIKAANINITQAYAISALLMTIIAIIVMCNIDTTAYLLGSSKRLLPYVRDYMYWIIPSTPLIVVMSIGLFIIRLDGSPKYAMMCNVIPGVFNIVLDYVFIFPLSMGITGAALATAIAELMGCIMVLIYMTRFNQSVALCRIKMSVKSLRLTLRNIGYQARLGASGMIGELAIACLMFVGNYMFITYLGEDGVAAFSVACYCFPLVFMVGNAISQSAQPIISYNYSAGLSARVKQTLRLSILLGTAFGVLILIGGIFKSDIVIRQFIPNTASLAYQIAIEGFPYFSWAFPLFTLNLIFIGYQQSMERFKSATLFMILRGIILVIPTFLLLPKAIGIPGLWLAVPLSEATTFAIILAFFGWKKVRG